MCVCVCVCGSAVRHRANLKSLPVIVRCKCHLIWGRVRYAANQVWIWYGTVPLLGLIMQARGVLWTLKYELTGAPARSYT